MKRLLITAAILALATARPELYKENEDFQYSRSSSDDGTKAGFYGAQRGNMGGNYERAHNMDGVAQNQMSTAVKQVEGELGDGSNTRTGSVFTAANSRGIYGSGKYDLSNLQGRNFDEGVSYGDSQSHTSQSSHNSNHRHSSAASHNSDYNSQSRSQNSRYTGYQGTKNSDQALRSSNQEALENVLGTSDHNTGSASGYDSRYSMQSGYSGHSAYDHSNTDQHSSSGYRIYPQNRLIMTTPVRVVGRPGSRVAIPIGVQTYDASHSASTVDQNAISSDAEVLSNTDQTNYRPTNSAKNYESSYSYRKQWEKHNTRPEVIPLGTPTENPFPKNSELHDDTEAAHTSYGYHDASGSHSHSAHSNNAYSGYNANVKSASSSQAQHRSGYDSQHSASSSGFDANAHSHGAYNSGSATDSTNVGGDSNSRPKSYQSSYAYHKSWERQGDPYEIKPVSNSLQDGETSQRLSAASNSNGYSSHQYGSDRRQSHQRYSHGGLVDCDCDENGHIRVARSYNVAQNQRSQAHEGQEDMGQESQNLNQQEDMGQQVQTGWDLGQTENLDQQEDLGQQAQNGWARFEDLGQQTQTHNWNNQAQSSWENLGDKREKSQNQRDKLYDFGQRSQPDLGQYAQDSWNEKQTTEKSEELADLGQQSDKNYGQHQGHNDFSGQEPQLNLDLLHSFDQHSETSRKENEDKHATHHQSISDKVNDFEDQNIRNINKTQSDSDVENFEQQQNNFHQISQDQNTDLSQQTQNGWSSLDLEALSKDKKLNTGDQVKPVWEQTEDNMHQHSQSTDSLFKITTKPKEVKSLDYDNGFDIPWYLQEQNQQNRNDKNQQSHSIQSNQNFNTYRQYTSQNSFKNENHDSNSFSNSQSNSQGSSSLQNLWNKIYDFEQESSISHDTNSQSSYLNSWGQNYNNSFDFSENASHKNQFDTYHPWQSTVSKESMSTSTTEIPLQSIVPKESISTTEPKDDLELTHNAKDDDEIRSLDIGRGDIGSEDSSSLGTSTTNKPHPTFENKPRPQIFTSNFNNKQYKTPEEIETLSLTKESNESKALNNKNDIHIDQNIHQSDNTLNVLSINQQKWLEEENRVNSTSSNTANSGTQNSQNDDESTVSRQFGSHGESGRNTNNFNTNYAVVHRPVMPVSSSEHKPNDKIDDSQKNVHYEHGSEEIEQQGMEQQCKDQINCGQESDNLDQQSQTAWEQSLEDLAQQTQTAWKPQENIQQQSNDQQTSNFGNNENYDFYNQRYLTSNINKKPNHQMLENFQKTENRQYVENVQTIPEKKHQIMSPPIPATEKPGFWKSVGNKLSGAKDSVASWFRSS